MLMAIDIGIERILQLVIMPDSFPLHPGLFSDAPKEGKVRSLIRRVNPEAYQILVERDRSMLKT